MTEDEAATLRQMVVNEAYEEILAWSLKVNDEDPVADYALKAGVRAAAFHLIEHFDAKR